MMEEEDAHNGESILLFLEAAARGEKQVITTSLSNDPRLINTPHPQTGNTALIAAAGENRTKVIAILLEHGADVTFCNFANQTAVHVADADTRAQLLAAVTRISFPQLSMMQAAWQGDLERIQHLLSAGHAHYMHSRNGQGLTPVMLVLRDLDLFDSLNMGSDYRPDAVLQELLNHHVDTELLDNGGRSAVSYVSKVRSPLGQQLIDALERCGPPAGAYDEASCDLCPGTKPSLCDSPPDGFPSAATQDQSAEELSSDGIFQEILEEPPNPAADLAEEVTFQEMENFYQTQERKRPSFSRQWLTDPAAKLQPQQSTTTRFPNLPPLLGKDASKLERLGLGYLVPESYCEPNILQHHLNPNPLRDIKYIKGQIWHRLGSAETSRDSKTFPPLTPSSRSPIPAKLRPLSKIISRHKEATRSSTALPSDHLADLKSGKIPNELKLQKSMQDAEDLVLSREMVQISLESCISSENQQSSRDDHTSKNAEDRGRTGSRRRESTENGEIARRHISCRGSKTLLHTNDKANCVEADGSLHIEHLQLHESFRKNQASAMDDPPCTREETELEKHGKNKTIEENLGTATPATDDTKKKSELKTIDLSRTPRTSHIPFVHITFSEQKPEIEIYSSPSKPLFTKRKTKPGSLLHNVNHSFNILAQKENEKTKKSRKTRIMSAPDNTKQQRPLSNSNRCNGKSVPLPTLVYSSVPSSSKVSKRVASSAQGSANRNIERSQTQLSIYSQKQINSPSNTSILPRSKCSHDFQDIKYSDMFLEITSQQGAGPVMYQMFPPSVFVNASNSGRETNSASSTRSCSSKSSCSSSSRHNSARSKRTKAKGKKSPSATSHRRQNSASKLEKVESKTENIIIISGVDWEIKTEKQEEDHVVLPSDEMMDSKHPIFELPTIKEATLENSITIHETIKENLKMLRELERRSINMESNKPENVDQGLLKEVSVQQDNGLTDNSCHGEDLKTGSSPRAEETLRTPKVEALEDWVHDDRCQKGTSTETKNNADFTYSTQECHSFVGSEHLTAELISCLENLMISEEFTGTVVDDRKDGDHSTTFRERQADDGHTDQSQVITNPSLKDQKSDLNNSHPTANHSGLHHERSIHWIKGEVLGRGAYGTVYRGLTSQGELIAAKQVTLHGSEPAVAEKEYKKLQEEVDLLKTLKHINIVGYLGTSFDETVVTIFMEYVPGGSISSILRHFGPLQEVVISRYTSHILQGIAYLHKNRVVHRDIKGNNVMLMPNGVIKLIDFGCAKRLNGLSINGTHGELLQSMHGTPYWMAPEVISESGHGEKSDIWSIGCTVFEMATGKPPLAHMERMAAMFYIGVEKGLMPTLPDHFSRRAREFVNLCLTRDQEKRPSAEQLHQHSFVSWTS
ncbi:mitogen-activated protein kinase kinase kinase 19 isoform X1 [Ranitomeya variabilis]|uniref:mitogen-activated protein kinase kinase kinase 19 isoform X1 n=1 Tax=Ranitomeya variabilis TaxID=490064 RepID=UPI0040570D90